MLFIKKHIPHAYLQRKQCQIDNKIIEISTQKRSLKTIAGYCSTNKDVTKQDLKTLFLFNERTILLADLNANNRNWGCNMTNPSGRAKLLPIQKHIITHFYSADTLPHNRQTYDNEYNNHTKCRRRSWPLRSARLKLRSQFNFHRSSHHQKATL